MCIRQQAFYSSCGPEIYDFYVEGDLVVIECSPVKKSDFILTDIPPELSVHQKEL